MIRTIDRLPGDNAMGRDIVRFTYQRRGTTMLRLNSLDRRAAKYSYYYKSVDFRRFGLGDGEW